MSNFSETNQPKQPKLRGPRSEETKAKCSIAQKGKPREYLLGKAGGNSSTGEYGITWRKDLGRWAVRIKNKKYGSFLTIEEAMVKRDQVLSSDTPVEQDINIPDDLAGQTFTRWTVLSKAESFGGGSRWLCLCECGTERIVLADTLKGGRSQSCGCLGNTNDLTGQTHGLLTAIRLIGNAKCGHKLWLCRCRCGNEKEVIGSALVSGRIGSCGCAKSTGEIVRSQECRDGKMRRIKERYETDICFNLNRRMSASIRLGLRRKNALKLKRWLHIVDYTLDELRAHLETTMPSGYSWDDYLSGALHIDHIIPLDAFSYDSEYHPHFRMVWALRNLRLLPGLTNMQKNRYFNLQDLTDYLATFEDVGSPIHEPSQ
jgi:hypothetical protein